MSALKEFADFITLNMANLAATYAQLLAESNAGYEIFPADSRITSARKLLKAVINAYESQTFDPLIGLFETHPNENSRRWAEHIDPPYPLAEIECLGQTLTPVITNLEAGKFLWDMLLDLRTTVHQTMKSLPTLPLDILEDDGEGFSEDVTERHRIEEALRESEERTRSVLNIALDAIIAMDADGLIIDWNRQAETIFGWSRQEAVGRSLSNTIIPPQYREAHMQGLKHFRATNEGPILNQRIEITALRRDGHEFPVELTVSPLQLGDTIIFNAFVRDITDRKRLEQQIQESLERRTHQVQTSTQVAQEIVAAPALDDLFRRVVNLVQDRFGYYHAHIYTLEEGSLVMQEGTGQTGRRMKEIGHKIALSAEKSLVARAARGGEPVLIPDVAKEPSWLPNPLLPETKSELAVPIKLKDEVLGVLDVQHDIVEGLSREDQILLMGLCGQIAVAINHRRTEAARKQAQELTQESEERYRLLLDSSPDPIVTYDNNGQVIFINSAFTQTFGWSEAELLGKRVDFVPEESWSETKTALDRLSIEGKVVGFETKRLTKDGRILDVQQSGAVIKDREGNPTSTIIFMRDITGLKVAQKTTQQQARREQTIREITEKMRTATTLDELVKTTAKELGERLSAGHAIIELGIDSPEKHSPPPDNGRE